jgi:bacteriorhodopsin
MYIYFGLGILFAFIVEVLICNEWNPKVPKHQQLSFNLLERILIILLWPIWLVKMIERYMRKNL